MSNDTLVYKSCVTTQFESLITVYYLMRRITNNLVNTISVSLLYIYNIFIPSHMAHNHSIKST